MLDSLNANEIAPGLWRWTAWHPEWKQDVGCLALAAGDDLVLVDPLIPEDHAAAWEDLAAAIGRAARTDVVLTVFYHDRSAGAIRARWPDVPVRVEVGGIENIPDVVTDPYRAGDPLPGGLVARPVPRDGEAVLWAQSAAAVIAGDVLLGKEGGLAVCPGSWLPEGIDRAAMAAALEPLLDLPLERVIVSHGEPILADARPALAAAITDARA